MSLTLCTWPCRGTYKYPNGDQYEGESRNGQKHGYGVFSAANGAVYSGWWKEGKKSGKGVFVSASGKKTEAWFKDDKPDPTCVAACLTFWRCFVSRASLFRIQAWWMTGLTSHALWQIPFIVVRIIPPSVLLLPSSSMTSCPSSFTAVSPVHSGQSLLRYFPSKI